MIVDCCICRNRPTECCICIHEEDREDYYDPRTDEEVAAQEAEDRREMEERNTSETIGISVSEDLAELFRKAKNIASSYNPPLMGVYVGDSFLRASDAHVIAEIACEAPLELAGKYVLAIGDDGARISGARSPLAKEDIWEVLHEPREAVWAGTAGSFRGLLSEREETDRSYHLFDFTVSDGSWVLREDVTEKALSLFRADEAITVYGGKENPVMLVIRGVRAKAGLATASIGYREASDNA